MFKANFNERLLNIIIKNRYTLHYHIQINIFITVLSSVKLFFQYLLIFFKNVNKTEFIL